MNLAILRSLPQGNAEKVAAFSACRLDLCSGNAQFDPDRASLTPAVPVRTVDRSLLHACTQVFAVGGYALRARHGRQSCQERMSENHP